MIAYNMAGEVSQVNKGHLDNSIFNNDELVYIGIKIRNNHRCAALRSLTVKTIRRSGLNRQGCRGGRRRIQHSGQNGDLGLSWMKNRKKKNLIEVNNGELLARTARSAHASGTKLSYEPNELRAINDWNKHDKRLKILPFGTIR